MTGKGGRHAAVLTDRQKLEWLRLLRSENVGPATFRLLINRFGGAREALEALPELSARGGLKRSIRICPLHDAERELAMASRLGARLVTAGEAGYPPRLAGVEGGPPLLYASGNLAVTGRPMVAIVGSRNCSALGRRLVTMLANDLAAEGIVVVSGLARGIDTAAHQASLAGGTIAIVAGGHGHLYPAENVPLAEEIKTSGAILSEMPPDWVARAKDFPRRNRIISGVSYGVVVVEAAARSGSLITARCALEQGREVFAVPGSPLDPRADGTNRLIRQGATLTRKADDVLEVLRPMLGMPPPPVAPLSEPDTGSRRPEDIDESDRRQIIDALGPSPVAIDDILRLTGLSAGQVMLALIELELAGRIERHAGQRVSLI
ncbi:DNA-processing protein DprA [Microbaculum marinum]|uniref:DNA-processing protein DprA n=1 Tax=Microbaculum marinum TaxID=1764581 RepID=A0AAW9RIA5_9HYPH